MKQIYYVIQALIHGRSSNIIKVVSLGLGLSLIHICPGHAEDLHTATYTVNVGGTYSIWKDHINLIAELNDGKYFSGGIFFKLHLK